MAENVEQNPNVGFRKSTGWDTPELDRLNNEVAVQHAAEYAPVVDRVIKSVSPTATQQDRLAAADDFGKVANTARIGDVIQSIVNLNPRDLYIALTGGANIEERGYDGGSNPYAVVYNQRGELRGYKNPETGRMLTEKELATIGPITSKRDVTAERTAAYKAKGVSLEEVAKARTASFLQTQNAAKEAGKYGALIADLGAQNDEITQRLTPATLPVKTLAFVRGIGSIGVGDTETVRKGTEELARFSKGKATNDEWRKTQEALGGLAIGLQYREGEGLTDASGKRMTEEDVKSHADIYSRSLSSNKNIQARQNDLLSRAQTLAAGDENLLRDMTTLINNNAKISMAQNDIEKAGGISVAKPNLPHELGESFYSANIKAKSDRMYGELAQLHSQFMAAKAGTLLPGQSPDIGTWEAEFANLPQVKKLRSDTKKSADEYIIRMQPEIERLNAQNVPRELTNEGMVAAPAKAIPETKAAVPPRTTTEPKLSPKPETKTPARKALNDILGIK
jgi:hypothetical protein